MKQYNLKYLWRNLKYAFTDWRNSIRIEGLRNTILAKGITSPQEAISEDNTSPTPAVIGDSAEYFGRNSREYYQKSHRLIYDTDGNLRTEKGNLVTEETDYDFNKWYLSLPK